MSGSIGIASEKERKKEERRICKRRKNLTNGISFPNFYTNDTNGHDIKYS